MKTAIRIISLAGSPRREVLHPPPDALQLDWRFLDAATGIIDGLSFDPQLSYKHSGRLLVGGEIGVYASHVLAWRELLADPAIAQMIVFEDDFFADWNLLAQAAQVPWSEIGADYLKFFIKRPAKFRALSWTYPLPDRHIVQYTTLALSSGAYLITRRAAARFVAMLGDVSRPIDIAMDRPWATGIPVLGIVPVAAMEISSPSTIHHRETGYSNPIAKPIYYAGRALEHAHALLYRLFAPAVRLRRIDLAAPPPQAPMPAPAAPVPLAAAAGHKNASEMAGHDD